jgi:arylsulfatase A-like enzyme
MTAIRSAVLVTVDCLRADHVGFLGYSRPTTPFLDSLAAEAQIFRQAIVAGAPTYHSIPAILASRYPLALGRDVLGIAPGEPTLATVFKSLGHRTAAFLAGNPYLSPRFGYEQGFDTFKDFLAPGSPTQSHSELERNDRLRTKWNRRLAEACHTFEALGSVYDELYFQYCERLANPSQSLSELRRFPAADTVIDAAIQWLESIGNAPFFLWLHLMDPHAPYYPTEQALHWMGSQTNATRARYLNSYWNRRELPAHRVAPYRDEIVTLYDAGIRWVDTQMETLAKHLQHVGAWDDYVLAFTADHGEEFLDHGGRYHAPATLFEEIVHVPLLLWTSATRAQTVDEPFSLLRLAPAILDEAGVANADRGYPKFHSASGAQFSQAVIAECISGCTNPFEEEDRIGSREMAVREDRYKLVIDFSSGEDRLCDLATDPQELNPLAPGAEKPVRAKLLSRARQHLADSYQLPDAELCAQARLRDIRLKLANSPIKVAV